MKRRISFIFILTVFLILAASFSTQAIMVRVTPDELALRAPVIVRGEIVQVTPSFDPSNGRIVSQVTIEVEQRIKGDTPDVFSLKIPGGMIGNDLMFVTNYPYFEQYEQVVLFLSEDLREIEGLMQGKFTVENGLILELGLDATDFIDSIRNISIGVAPVVNVDTRFNPVSFEQGLLNTIGHGKFGYDGLKWNKHSIDIYINENLNGQTGEGNAIRAGMAEWNGAPANFTFDYAGSHSRTSDYQNYKNETMWGWTSVDAIAYAACWGDGWGYLIECDLLFNNSYNWSAQGSPGSNEMDVENIATHEFGHFLQLLDLYNNSDWEKTMYGYASNGETLKRSLHQDDKNGIAYIYGTGPSDDDDDDDDDTPPPDDDDDDNTPPPDDDDDDDWTPDDDDDDDEDPDFEDDADSCSDLMNLFYNDCGFTIVVSGEPAPGEWLYDKCKEGGNPWPCMFECVNHENVDSCETFLSCLTDKCDLNISGGDGGDDDDDDDAALFCG